jgi:hypothetical protein
MNFVPAVILIIVAAIAGYVLGIVDSRITTSLKKKVEDAPPPEAQKPASDVIQPGEHNVLRVSIDTALKWHVQLDNTRLEDPGTLSLEQRQRLANVIVQLRPWMGTQPVVDEPVSMPPADLPSRTATPAVPKPANPAPVPANAAPLKIDALRGFRSLLKSEIKAPSETKSMSIVAMIDEVLQARLLIMPQITKSVRLEEGALGEVIVFVGSTSYPGVDSVPDPEIRSVIKAAIADWDKKR